MLNLRFNVQRTTIDLPAHASKQSGKRKGDDPLSAAKLTQQSMFG